MDQDYPEIGSRQIPKSNNPQNTTSGKKTLDKLPPIHIASMRGEQLNDILRNLKIKNYSIKKTGVGKHLLQMVDIDDFRITQVKLKDLSVRHFTYTPKQDRNKTYLLRGLDGDEEPKQILEELKELNITKVEFVKVSKFITKQKRKLTFQVQISPNSDENNLFKEKKVCNTVVMWETIKKREVISKNGLHVRKV